MKRKMMVFSLVCLMSMSFASITNAGPLFSKEISQTRKEVERPGNSWSYVNNDSRPMTLFAPSNYTGGQAADTKFNAEMTAFGAKIGGSYNTSETNKTAGMRDINIHPHSRVDISETYKDDEVTTEKKNCLTGKIKTDIKRENKRCHIQHTQDSIPDIKKARFDDIKTSDKGTSTHDLQSDTGSDEEYYSASEE